MKTINFSTILENEANLQNLKDELSNVGIKAFVIDYENQQISITNPHEITAKTINCAVRKAGFKCSCFKVCNHKKD